MLYWYKIIFLFVQEFTINGKQTIEFKDSDLEFLAATGAGEGMDFYDVKDVVVNYQCAGTCNWHLRLNVLVLCIIFCRYQ